LRRFVTIDVEGFNGRVPYVGNESMIRLGVLVGAILLLQTAAAGAAPRDDMLSGISRCNSFTDERTFLDCVYGAAQPVRAELGLPPAPQDQTRLVPSATMNAVALPPVPNAAAQPTQSRGFISKLFGTGKPVTRPQAMRSYVFNADGLFTVRLSNGEEWRQDGGDNSRAHWTKAASSYVVTVVTGALGSFDLQVSGESVFYKVQRQR
jgi:hypothetical protein